MELEVPEGGDAERETNPMPQAQGGTLDLDLIISKLLSYKDDPGKQVWLLSNRYSLTVHEYAHSCVQPGS